MWLVGCLGEWPDKQTRGSRLLIWICSYTGATDAWDGSNTKSKFRTGSSSQPIYMDDLACGGHERALDDCGHVKAHNCQHSEDASMQCKEAMVYT